MSVQQLGNERTIAYTDGPYLVMERIFDAPRELVWKVLTDPERVPRWWGPRSTTMTVEEMDVRPGGHWRWVAHSAEGDAPFKGEYLEVVPPERLVRTEIFDVPPYNSGPDPAAVETMTLEDLGGRTKLVSRRVAHSRRTTAWPTRSPGIDLAAPQEGAHRYDRRALSMFAQVGSARSTAPIGSSDVKYPPPPSRHAR
jgi:uncharacterized protein YndB with AHSA1/START domain